MKSADDLAPLLLIRYHSSVTPLQNLIKKKKHINKAGGFFFFWTQKTAAPGFCRSALGSFGSIPPERERAAAPPSTAQLGPPAAALSGRVLTTLRVNFSREVRRPCSLSGCCCAGRGGVRKGSNGGGGD